MKKYVYATLIFLLAAGGACVAQSDQPTLGELARKHRQEEKNLAVKAKVLTNEDVATSTPSAQAQSAPAVSSSTATPPSAAAAKSQDQASDKGKSPAATSSVASKDTPEVAELKQKLSSYKQQQDGWKQSAKKNEDLLANETSDFRRQMYQDALQGDKQNVQVMQDKIDQAQSDLEKAEKSSSQNH
ncbi:MAG TPA: hypothetical protein VHW72_05920 [Candidatus Angelobacter sp.]|jgi:hypothetical protein|nr:hypothetical protein [Candidatus Angelobacter sp.]